MGIFDKLFHKKERPWWKSAHPHTAWVSYMKKDPSVHFTPYGTYKIDKLAAKCGDTDDYVGGWKILASWEDGTVHGTDFTEYSDTFVPAWVISSFLRKLEKRGRLIPSIDPSLPQNEKTVMVFTRGRNQYRVTAWQGDWGYEGRIFWRLLDHPQRRQRRAER